MKRMAKNSVLLFVMLGMVYSTYGWLPGVRVQWEVAQAQVVGSVNIGDYIQFGKYYGAPILWRVIHKDANGDPILFADRILTLKAFDAAGGYHAATAVRNAYGSNFYPDSNIRQWLNSSSLNNGTDPIDWIQNDPSAENLYGGHNPYHSEKGFLADGNFSLTERALIKPYTHKVLLSPLDQSHKAGGTEGFAMPYTLSGTTDFQNALKNYDTTAFFKNVTDDVFLLSIKQVKEWVIDKKSLLGENYQTAKPTDQAVLNSTYNDVNLNSDKGWPYRLNTSSGEGDEGNTVFYTYSSGISDDGKLVMGITSSISSVGIRPALQLNLADAVFTANGNGKRNTPYTVWDGTTPLPAPLAPTGLKASDIEQTTMTLSWNPSPAAFNVTRYELYRGSTKFATVTGTDGQPPPTNFAVTGLKANTAYSFTIRAVDPSGNISGPSQPVNVTTLAPPLIDNTPPTVPGEFKVTAIKPDGFTLSWKGAADSGGSGVGAYELYLDDASRPVARVTSTSYTFAGLNPDTGYSLRVRATDRAGNSSANSEPYLVRTSADLEAPTIPAELFHDQVRDTGFRFTWAPAKDNFAVAGYEVFINGVSIGKTTDTSKVFDDLTANTEYTLTVKAYDAAGNTSAESASYKAKTYVDKEAPSAAEELRSVQTNATGTLIKWTQAEDNQVIAGYEVFMQSGDDEPVKAATTKIPIAELTGLSPDTTYRVTVKAFDAAGPVPNTSELSDPLQITTASDAEPPTAPDRLQAKSIKDNRFVIEWAASIDNLGVDSYEIYKDGKLLDKLPKSNNLKESYEVTALDANQSYTMTVVAVDVFGMRSPVSMPLFVTTASKEEVGPELELTHLPSYVNQSATIEYTLETDAYMEIRLLNAANSVVATPVNHVLTRKGERMQSISTKSIKSGRYAMQMIARDATTGKRTILYKAVSVNQSSPPMLTILTNNMNGKFIFVSETASKAWIRFNLDQSGFTARITITQSGQNVRVLTANVKQTGTHEVSWNLLNSKRKKVADGEYKVTVGLFPQGKKVKNPVVTKSVPLFVERLVPTVAVPNKGIVKWKQSQSHKWTIPYTLSEEADVVILIQETKNGVVNPDALRKLTFDDRKAGWKAAYWDGLDDSNNLVISVGRTFVYKIYATDKYKKKSIETRGQITVSK